MCWLTTERGSGRRPLLSADRGRSRPRRPDRDAKRPHPVVAGHVLCSGRVGRFRPLGCSEGPKAKKSAKGSSPRRSVPVWSWPWASPGYEARAAIPESVPQDETSWARCEDLRSVSVERLVAVPWGQSRSKSWGRHRTDPATAGALVGLGRRRPGDERAGTLGLYIVARQRLHPAENR